MTDVLTEIQDKANDAFYLWERANNEQDLSDRDRMLWTAGWIQAKTDIESITILRMREAIDNMFDAVEEGDAESIVHLALQYKKLFGGIAK
jgi:hypothetical protein